MNNKNRFINNDKILSHIESFYKWVNAEDVSPITVELHVTERCNNKCFYCNYAQSSKDMSLEDAQTVITKLAKIDTKAIILSGGGEPTLYPKLKEVIDTINSCGMESALITNLLVKDTELYESIVNHCCWCRVSLDSGNPEVYKKIRGVDGFEAVISNIKYLVALKRKEKSPLTIGLQCVVNKHNSAEIFDEIKTASHLGVNYIQIRPVEIMPNERLAYTKRQFDSVMRQIEAARKFKRKDFDIITSKKWQVLNPYVKKKEHAFSFCHAYMMIGAIDVRGDFFVCCHQIENKNKRLCYGNAIKEKINVIMKRRQEISQRIDLSKCYLECRASDVNRFLERVSNDKPHKNFL